MTIPYHQAKELIEKRICEYTANFDETELPTIEINRKGKDTHIEFSIGKHADLYNIVDTLVKTIGEMKIQESIGGLILKHNETNIYFGDKFRNSFRLLKEGDLTSQEIDAVLKIYIVSNSIKERKPPKQILLELGTIVYDADNTDKNFSWDYLAGYDEVKQEIKDTILLPLKHPEFYEQITLKTRKKHETIKPKAVLFEGPPGTGKTTTARIIANESNSPMIYVPIESIMTKWYGESERNLASIFEACNDLENSLIFLDEIDSLATSREKNLHEATRRVLSVLLRKIDGFEPNNKTILIGATNRKQDLDNALISRFDVSIYFHLPNTKERIAIFRNYAKHLCNADLEKLAQESEGISGRDIKDLCEHSERRWVSKSLRENKTAAIPPLEEYLNSLKIIKIPLLND